MSAGVVEETVWVSVAKADPDGKPVEDWHEYALVCRGSTITLAVDGEQVAEVVDDVPAQQDLRGILALQLHSGPPMTVQFKDIRLARLGH